MRPDNNVEYNLITMKCLRYLYEQGKIEENGLIQAFKYFFPDIYEDGIENAENDAKNIINKHTLPDGKLAQRWEEDYNLILGHLIGQKIVNA